MSITRRAILGLLLLLALILPVLSNVVGGVAAEQQSANTSAGQSLVHITQQNLATR
ncbi:hypothetical protein [Alicyclobacillus tolerans]|uniref:Uncharacterized protein n=1 Tax=Alicyclobacillus tolerans TaxID=90970 RepID=A0A1M6UCG6_9BACL|nr:hypothetical protein [Alicyclobacillus montanus]SHK66860.1 hypothetical protein SAMN05443507_11940 [Alicyclobacillus montanus]